MEEFNLNSISEHKGKWSLDLNDIIDKKGIENAIPGTLKIDNGRVRLELNGILNDSKNVKFDEGVDIYGYLNNGLLVKLEKCYLIFINFISQGYDIENYESYRGFIIDSNNSVCLLDQSLKATQIRFSMNFIDEWYNIDLPEKEEISNGRGFSIRYKNSFFDENEHEVMDGKIFIKLARNQSANFNIHKGVSPVLDSFIKIYVKDYTPVSLNELLGYSMWTKDFINFITHISGNLTYITFLLEDNDNRYRMEELENGKINFKLPFYEGRYIFPQVTYNNSELQFRSLRLKDIFKDFGKLINNWFNNKDKLEYIISLYFQNQLTYLDVNTKLVNQIMILETYYDNFKTKEREFICDRDIKVNEAKSKLKDQINSFDLEYSIKEELI